MFIFAEGTTDYDPLNAENVVDIGPNFGMKIIYAAFYDPFSDLIRVIHTSNSVNQFIAQGIRVVLAPGASPKSASVQLADQTRLNVDIGTGGKIISSVVLSNILWLAVSKVTKGNTIVQVFL